METFTTHEEFYRYLFKEILEKKYSELPEFGGAKKKYPTPKHMAEKAIEYLMHCHNTNSRIHFHGMRLHLKLFTPAEFLAYRNVKEHTEDFTKVVNIIRALMEKFAVDQLFDPRTFNASRFVLQCCYSDWIPVEKVITENHDISVTIGAKKQEPEQDQEENPENY
jgi:hypothetical protein